MTTKSSSAIPFSVDISRMIELLASQIYPSPFALLRENVQNAFDAIMLRRHTGDGFDARIEVLIEPHRIVVTDNGIGMSRQELRDHFWRAGSSSKNNDEARAAGVVGTFGIGAMANFGIADELEVESESADPAERTRCVANRSTLSVTDDCIDFINLPIEGSPGSRVVATMKPDRAINVETAVQYISEFVCFVDVSVVVNGQLVSQNPLEQALPDFSSSWKWTGESVFLGNSLRADLVISGSSSGDVRVDVSKITLGDREITGRMILKQGLGAIRTFRNKFGLATASIPSSYQLGGVADFLILKPTAGREALTTDSLNFLNSFASPLDELISTHLAERPEANNSQNFVGWVTAHHRWDLCGQLRARIEPGDSSTLFELASFSKTRPLLIYGGNDPATLKHASEERPLVQLSRNHQRRLCEQNYLAQYGKVEALNDEPRIISRMVNSELTTPQSALVFRLTEILNSDYFLTADLGFGSISHGLPILVAGQGPVTIILDPNASNVRVILEIYSKEYGAFSHLSKDFVRNVIFPRVSHLVPSATRQGTEAFLKTLQRTRDVFEYERSDLENLTSLWTDYLEGRITMEQATVKAASAQRSYQLLEPGTMGQVRDVVPDVEDGDQLSPTVADPEPNLSPMPPIQRMDIETDRKLLTIEPGAPPLKGYRRFLAISKRIRDERGDFFLQPHRTSVVWGGQKALFIFEHHSGEVGLYYDIQMNEPVSGTSGGGAFETCTIVMKNQIFIPVPADLEDAFMPNMGETKRLEVRCDLLYIDSRDRP